MSPDINEYYLNTPGYGKRSLSGHDAAPYSLLVDHLAAATDAKETTFANISTIECPSKPSDYTCPRVLTLTKEELKKKICENYETVVSGSVALIPETEKAQTRCGTMRIAKPVFKDDEDSVELTNKMAVVFGKDCDLKSIIDKENTNETNKSQQQFHILIKASIPSDTKFILADGANMDLVSSSIVTRDEIAAMLKQCPKA